MKDAPLYRDTFALCGVLLEELAPESRFPKLRLRLEEGALRLLDEVTLALAGFDRTTRVQCADAELRTLRTMLGLAHELGLLPEDIYLALAAQADTVGRQVGGWRKKLERTPDA